MRRSTILLLLIIYLGTGLRLYSLGDEDLWLDETSSVYYAEQLIPSMVTKLASGQYEDGQLVFEEWRRNEPSHPPLYYILLHFWMVMGRDETSIRLLSVLAGIISIPVLYWLAKTLFNEHVGLLSALLLAVSPLHIEYSQEARMYSLITLFVLLSTYFMIGFLKTNRRAWRIGYVLLATMSLYAQYITVFALLFQNLVALIFCWQRRDKRRLRTWLAMQVCVLLLFSLWIPFFLSQFSRSVGGTSVQYTIPAKLPIWAFRVFSLGRYAWELPLWINVIGLLGFLVFIICGVFALGASGAAEEEPWWRIKIEVLFCLTYLFAAGLAILLVYPLNRAYPRLALFGLPAFYILAARGIEWISRGSKAKMSIVVACTILLLTPVMVDFYQRDSRENWSALVDYVLNEAQPGDVVVVHAFYIHKAFNYYAAGRLPAYVELVGVDYPLDDIPASVRTVSQGRNRLWLVLSRMYAVDPNWALKKYLDQHYEVVEERNFRGIDGVFLYGIQ